MDWQDIWLFLKNNIGTIKEIVTVFTSIFLAIVAFLGLQTWKKQLTGKTDYELAKKILHIVYSIRESIKYLRSAWILSGSEIEEAIKASGVDIEEENGLSSTDRTAAVFQYRWEKIREGLVDLSSASFEAEALWGKRSKTVFTDFRKRIVELNHAIEDYIQSRQADSHISPSRRKESYQIVFGTGSLDNTKSENKFERDFSQAIREIEEYLRPKLKP